MQEVEVLPSSSEKYKKQKSPFDILCMLVYNVNIYCTVYIIFHASAGKLVIVFNKSKSRGWDSINNHLFLLEIKADTLTVVRTQTSLYGAGITTIQWINAVLKDWHIELQCMQSRFWLSSMVSLEGITKRF